MAHDVFVSYAHADKPVADAVCALLERRGLRCWIAPRDVVPGRAWGESIVEAIDASWAMVILLSAQSNLSAYVLREVERAVSYGKPIIPMRIEDVRPSRGLELFISSQHWLDALSPPMEQHIERLAEMLQVLAAYRAQQRSTSQIDEVGGDSDAPQSEPVSDQPSALIQSERERQAQVQTATPSPTSEPQPLLMTNTATRARPAVRRAGITLAVLGVLAAVLLGLVAVRGRPPWSVVLPISSSNGVTRGLAVDRQGGLYVADDAQLTQLSPTGRTLAQWAWSDTGRGQVGRVAGIAVDGSQNVLVLDLKSSRVERFSPDGQFLDSWGSAGTGAGQLSLDYTYAGLIGADAQGDVYISDLKQSRIQKFAPGGKLLAQAAIQSPSGAHQALAVDQAGNVWTVADEGSIVEFSSDLQPRARVQHDFSSALATPGLTLDAQGNLYFVLDSAERVVELSPSGEELGRWQAGGLGQPKRPYLVAWDTANGVYVGTSNTVFRLALHGWW